MGKAAALRAALSLVADGALAVVLAPACAACRAPLDHPTRGAVCDRCWSSIVPITPPCCRTCGDPLPSWRTLSLEQARCPRCRRRPPVITLGRAVGPYEGSLRAIIHALKYSHRPTIASALAARMAMAGGDVLDGADAVVPVPLHRSRERSRGFNQARELARHLPLPMLDVLARTRRTEAQANLPASRRSQNVRNAFAVTAALKCRATRTHVNRRSLLAWRVARSFSCADVRGATLVLIDDVATTGATLNACAEALRAAGALEVRALTAAKAVASAR